MRYSHSKVECYEGCPYKYDLRYVQKLKTLPNDDPANPLIIGTAMHTGIETDVRTAIQQYYMSFPIITDAHIIEATKLEAMIPKVKKLIQDVCKGKLTFEYELKTSTFNGYLDLLEEVTSDYCNIYDFKYSNNVDHYLESRQLHIYKYETEKNTNFKVLNLNYIMIPKVSIKQKKTETELEFKRRLQMELDKAEPYIVPVQYDVQKVINHKELIEEIENNRSVEKKTSNLCARFCEYHNYCKSNGKIDYDIIYPEDIKIGK